MGGSKWDEILQKLTKSFSPELNKINRRDIIKFCLKNKTTRNAAENFLKNYTKSNQKNSVIANQKKEEGNKKYSKKNYRESLLLYTESIFYANENDECLPLAYSNRALVLQQMGYLPESLKDINMALKSGYPKSKSGKLILRQAKCLTEMGDIEKAREILTQALEDCDREEFSIAFKNELERIKKLKNKQVLSPTDSLPELAGGENNNFVSASKYLDVNYDRDKGRYVTANVDIQAGDVLFVEKPFAYVLFEKNCQNCLKSSQAPIPCWNCMDVLYCSSECRDEFWKLVHSFECGFAKLFKSVGIAHLSLRIVLNASSSLEEFKRVLKNVSEVEYKPGIVQFQSKDYDSVYNLVHNFDKHKPDDLFQYAMTAVLLTLYMKNQTSYFKGISEEEDLELLTSIIFRHIMQLICNGYSITRTFNEELQAEHVVSKREGSCGTAIYTSSSMMNHSCEASIINSFLGKWLVIRAVKAIKKGEEVFNCYGPMARRMKRSVRQESLSNQYFFQCKCEACLQDFDIQDLFKAFKCTKCKGPSVAETENSKSLFCLACGLTSEYSAELSSKCNKFYSLIQEGVLEQNKGVPVTLRKFLESWLLGREIFYKFNEDLCYAANEVAKCLASLKDYRRCVLFLKCCVRAVEVRFGSFSIELADEMKLLGDIISCYIINSNGNENRSLAQEGVLCYEKSHQIISVLYGSECKDLKEIELNNYLLKEFIKTRFLK